MSSTRRHNEKSKTEAANRQVKAGRTEGKDGTHTFYFLKTCPRESDNVTRYRTHSFPKKHLD